MIILKYIKNNLLLILVIIISLFGILMIYSSSYIWSMYKYNNPYKYLISQSIFFIIGLFLIFIIKKIDYNFYKTNANKILLISFILLILVLIPGIGKLRNGSRSWFALGPFGFQPSEFAKLSLIIFTSKYLSNNNDEIRNIKKTILPLLLVISIFFILIMLEPDFGQAFVITLSLISIIFISGTKLSFFIKCFIFCLMGIIALVIVAPYRLARIVSYLNPWVDPLGSGFQIIQSLYAIGPGGLLGLGLTNSIQKHFYLPEPQTDFIFAIISEEFGFLGVLIITSIFFLIFYKSIKISMSSKDLFSKYLVFGLSIEIIIQVILNLSVVTGLIPVTGITLPFLSYGGSSLLVSMISIAIIISVEKNNLSQK
ncbi:MAG: putative lipid II flippase FtsW [Firmicutes bacterium]|nr:putative lipid II flippase FtsW [Bacillota bacterium]